MKLSSRLQACCGFISPGDRVADIGTDHGYLGIWLLENGIAASVIAADIVPGPLSAARRNARKYGCADKMDFYLSDGVQSIPHDFDAMVCAGMGADTIISILSAAPWLKDSRYKLILQCQSKTPALRQYLSGNGWHIQAETIVRDGRFLYTVMEVIFSPGHVLTPGQCYFPSVLQNASHAAEYYQRVITSLRRAIAGQKDQADPVMVAALQELDSDPTLLLLKEDLQ